MSRGHGHVHGERTGDRSRTRLAVTLGLIAVYMVAEAIGGILTGSLALLADAGHMLSDVGALGLALFAIWFARRPSGPRHTYGYYRTEILAALANAATLAAIAILIFVEALRRFESPPGVAGGPMVIVAAGGFLVNLTALRILHGATTENLNVRGAWLHVFADLIGSVQALVAGALIWAFGWNLADPIASILIAALVVYSSLGLLRESVAVLMESAPGHIDVDAVRTAMVAMPDVASVHDLHIWTITSGMESLSAHIVVRGGASPAAALRDLREMLHDQFGIDHITIQIEPEAFEECREAG